jgi:3-oxoacyl-[acyl-carrier protein] reductase
VAKEIEEAGGSSCVTCFDVTDPAAVERELATVLEAGPIQVLVNNAGIHDDAPLAGMSGRQWRNVIEVSLYGFFNVTQPLLLPMLQTRWGRIVAISSVTAVIGNRGQANYAAAKAGLHGVCRSLALEVASRGVTVNVVAPGIIESESAAQAFNADQIKTFVPMRRAGTPAEVAQLVDFLVSEKAAYISGQVIGINGGMG